MEIYRDDLVVYNKTNEYHTRYSEAVLKRIGEFGLCINKKSQIAKSNVTLLGYKAGDGEIKLLPDKMLTKKSIKTPISERKLRQFMGRAAFHSRFIRNFDEMAAPLNKLLSNEKFIWTE